MRWIALAATAVVAGNVCAAPTNPAPFMLSFWCAPPPTESSALRYQEVAECGFNVAMPPCAATDPQTNRRILDACQAAGIKAIIADRRIFAAQQDSANLAPYLDAVIADYSKHPALAGYFLTDEPNAAAFPVLGRINQYLLSKDPGHLPYVNLNPIYSDEGDLGTKTYDEYIARFIETVQPALVSWDHYALLPNGERKGYFQNLEIVRRHCLKAGLPFAQIILALAFGRYREPSDADLRWQVYTTLCYGAKGVLYFTYWTPHDPSRNFRPGMISEEGRRNPRYDAVRRLNMRVGALGRTLAALRSVAVYHTEPLPLGTEGLDPTSPVRAATGGEMVIGWLRDPANRDYLFVVNRSCRENIQARLVLDGKVKGVWEVSQLSGRVRRLNRNSTDCLLETQLEAGEGKLFRLDR